MVIENCKTYGYANFDLFLEKFKQTKWTSYFDQNYFRGSCFEYVGFENMSEIHANIIKFNKVGMILHPWSYFKFCLFMKKVKKDSVKSREISWSE